MLLRNKNAIIYGAAGAVGTAVARAFNREGANLFLAGRNLDKVKRLANELISIRGGKIIEAAEVDAMKADDVERHADEVIKKARSIDIVFNAISIADVQGKPLVEMPIGDFEQPVFNAMHSQFITSTTAARHMMRNGSGVILALTANAARAVYPDLGGFGVACAAIEALCRQLAYELGPHGIRVVCLRSAGSPDAAGVEEVFRTHAKNEGISLAQFEARFAEKTLLKRLPKLAEIANAAVLMASDNASAITGAITNLTCGELLD